MRHLNSIPTRTMTGLAVAAMLVLALAPSAQADPDWGNVPYTRFDEMQAVDATGAGTWSVPIPPDDPPGTNPGSDPGYKVWGVVLNNPGDMLDGTADHDAGSTGGMGGQWQVYVQTIDDPSRPTDLASDFGGAALWMGQNYGIMAWLGQVHPDDSYTDADWQAEVDRVSLNQTLKAGDLIEVHARGGLFHAGKVNVNEQHKIDTPFNFDVVRIQADFVLDMHTIAESILLEAVKDGSDAFIFDQSRAAGAEHYQATLVEIENVWVQDPGNWAPDGTVTLEDATGRTLPMKLGLDLAFGATAPTGTFDVVGIFDQESSASHTSGYRLWVTDAGQFGAASGVPEPTSAVLALLGLISLSALTARRRRSTAWGPRK